MTSTKKLREAVRKGMVDAIEDAMPEMLRNFNKVRSLQDDAASMRMSGFLRSGRQKRKITKITYNNDYKKSEQVSRMLEGLYEECSGACSTTGEFEFRFGMDATFLAYLLDKNAKHGTFTQLEIKRLFGIYKKHMPSDSKSVKRQLMNLGMRM